MAHSAEATAGDFETIEETGEGALDKSGTQDTSFEQQVNDAVGTMTQDEEGLWKLPEDHGLSEEAAYAANLEKRRRDTQSAAAKTSHKLEASEERAGKLESKLKEAFKPQLSIDEQEELEELKTSDPEEYRTKMNEYEAAALKVFDEEVADMGLTDDEVDEMADRSIQLTKFLEDNPGFALDDEVVENDLPPRLVKQLEEGAISFDKFLLAAKKILMPVSKKEEKDEPNLGDAGGGSQADDKAIGKDAESSYKNVIF